MRAKMVRMQTLHDLQEIEVEFAPPAWFKDAACKGADPRWFILDEGYGKDQRAQNLAAAKATCADCPIRARCEEYGRTVDKENQYGGSLSIYGGLTQRERRRHEPLQPALELTGKPRMEPPELRRTCVACLVTKPRGAFLWQEGGDAFWRMRRCEDCTKVKNRKRMNDKYKNDPEFRARRKEYAVQRKESA